MLNFFYLKTNFRTFKLKNLNMFKLIPRVSINTSIQEEHQTRLERFLNELIPPDLCFEDKDDFLNWAKNSLPILEWKEPSEIPGNLSVSFFCSPSRILYIESLFLDLLRQTLLLEREVSILSFNHVYFNLEGVHEKTFFVAEAKIVVENSRDLHYISLNLDLLKKDLALVLSYPLYSKYLSRSKAPIATHAKNSLVHYEIVYMLRRFPRFFDESLLDQMKRFLNLTTSWFIEQHQPQHLRRLICCIFILQKKLFGSPVLLKTRTLKIRLIPTDLIFPFCRKTVLVPDHISLY